MKTVAEAQRAFANSDGDLRRRVDKFDLNSTNEELLVTQALLTGASLTPAMNFSGTESGYKLAVGTADFGWWKSRRRAAIVMALLFELPVEVTP